MLFPRTDVQAAYELLYTVRDSFGKAVLIEEEALRLDGRRGVSTSQELPEVSGDGLDEFLKGLDAEVTMSFAKVPFDGRAFELINKTNQFNLNGQRVVENGWRRHLQKDDSFLLRVSYRDKYCPIGKIAALSGLIAAVEEEFSTAVRFISSPAILCYIESSDGGER